MYLFPSGHNYFYLCLHRYIYFLKALSSPRRLLFCFMVYGTKLCLFLTAKQFFFAVGSKSIKTYGSPAIFSIVIILIIFSVSKVFSFWQQEGDGDDESIRPFYFICSFIRSFVPVRIFNEGLPRLSKEYDRPSISHQRHKEAEKKMRQEE